MLGTFARHESQTLELHFVFVNTTVLALSDSASAEGQRREGCFLFVTALWLVVSLTWLWLCLSFSFCVFCFCLLLGERAVCLCRFSSFVQIDDSERNNGSIAISTTSRERQSFEDLEFQRIFQYFDFFVLRTDFYDAIAFVFNIFTNSADGCVGR